jgi:hypothetical protein
MKYFGVRKNHFECSSLGFVLDRIPTQDYISPTGKLIATILLSDSEEDDHPSSAGVSSQIGNGQPEATSYLIDGFARTELGVFGVRKTKEPGTVID